jgi:hypothetical protein
MLEERHDSIDAKCSLGHRVRQTECESLLQTSCIRAAN